MLENCDMCCPVNYKSTDGLVPSQILKTEMLQNTSCTCVESSAHDSDVLIMPNWYWATVVISFLPGINKIKACTMF